MILDFHAHCYPADIAARAVSKTFNTPYRACYDGTIEGLIADNHKSNIDFAVALNIANTPHANRRVNEFAVQVNGKEGIIAFGSVHPLADDYKYYIDFLLDHGIKGLKFHPYYQQYYVDDENAFRAYDYGADRGMILLFHGGYDLMVKGDFNTPARMKKIVDRYNYRVVAAHLGGWNAYEEALRLIVGSDCYIDTSFAFRFISDEQRQYVLDYHDSDKILFGTDRPWVNAKEEINLIKAVAGKQSEAILYHNGARLLGLEK